MNEATTPTLGWTSTQGLDSAPSADRSVVTFQLSAWHSNSWHLGQLAETQLEGMWRETLGVGLHKFFKHVGQEDFQLKTRQTFGKDCNTDSASCVLDQNAILQMIIYLDFRSFFLLILFTLKEGLLSNN